ncbi:MAG TPA: plasmid pRiA4b ORF-3 family protein, partial [Bacillota bacterium]|nr:plasmid pRiA4b ORF-3 family protein [Bacillota bacterium]
HKIAVEKTLTYDENIRYPKCTGGRRAAPPENSGGIRGYYALLEAFKDPVSEMHEESVEWLGEDFDPEAFDIDEINERLNI